MQDRIRCGLLGTGHAHATGKLHALQQSEDWELVGVCEPDPESRAQRQHQPAFAAVQWLSEEELLGDETVKMVAIESEVPDLLSLGRKAIAAGKHIHVDKPAGTSLEEFRALLEEAERKKLLVQMGYMFRYNAGFDLVRRAVADGWLGDVYYVHGNISTEVDSETRKRLAFHPGGMVLELSCHLIDIVVLLLGRPQKVAPFLRHDAPLDDGLADNTLAVFEWDNAVGIIESAAMESHPFSRRQFEVIGTRGSVILQPLEPPAIRLCLREDSQGISEGGYQAGWQTVEVHNVPRYVRDLEEFARCLRGEQSFPYPYHHDFTVQESVLRASGMS